MTISIAQAQLFFLALTRILAMMIQIPVLGGQSIPTQVRLALGIVFTAILIPWQPLPPDAATLGQLGFAVAIVKEIFIGTLCGFAASLTFGAIQIAGEVMGLGSGFSSGRIFNPAMNESGSAYNQLFVIVTMLVFLSMDGHHYFIAAMQKTFEIIPINGEIPLASFNTLAVMTSQMITAGVQLALPIMAALTLADLGLGFLARVAPQVQIYFLGLPLKVGISLISMGIFFTVAMEAINNLYVSVGPRMLQLLGR